MDVIIFQQTALQTSAEQCISVKGKCGKCGKCGHQSEYMESISTLSPLWTRMSVAIGAAEN